MAVVGGLNSAFAQDSSPVGEARSEQAHFEQPQFEQIRFQEPQSTADWQGSEEESGMSRLSDALTPDQTGVSPRYWFTPPNYGTYIQADALFLARSHDP